MENLPSNLQNTVTSNSPEISRVRVAIFWDYENMPFPKENPELFLSAMQHFSDVHNLVFAKVYIRKGSISPPMLDLLYNFPLLKIKWISSTRKNAVDTSIIDSAIDVISKNPRIHRVLFLSGDGDFYRLFRFFSMKHIKLTIVCRSGNFHKQILRSRHRIYSLFQLLENPTNWWSHKKALQMKQDLIESEKV